MTPEELLAQLSQPGPGEAYLATQGAGSGLFNFGGPFGALLTAQQLYKGYSGRKTAERQKQENLRLLALDAMAEQGIDPFAIYDLGKVESTIDPVEQAELDLAQQEMDILNPPQPVAEGYAAEQEIKRFREENPDIIGEAYDAFLRSGLDYDEYKKRLEEGETVVEEEEVSLEPDPELTSQQTFEGLEKEETLADIIGRWINRQTGPVTQERILEKIGELGYTGEDFDAAVEGSSIPSLENFVTEEDLEPSTGGDTGPDLETPSTPTSKPIVEPIPETPPPASPLEGGLEDTPQVPQLPFKEPGDAGNGEGGGMFAVALSPNRTTSEVLAPDLFKLDKNIPLVGRLTDYVAPAAPQMMLQGISQRYRV